MVQMMLYLLRMELESISSSEDAELCAHWHHDEQTGAGDDPTGCHLCCSSGTTLGWQESLWGGPCAHFSLTASFLWLIPSPRTESLLHGALSSFHGKQHFKNGIWRPGHLTISLGLHTDQLRKWWTCSQHR